MNSSPRILILTSGYGDGHNSAARGVAEALDGKAECRIVDPCKESMPFFFRWSRAGYLWTIRRAPLLWRQAYDWTDSLDLSRSEYPMMAAVKNYLSSLVRGWRPDAIVCTYMLYPHLLDKIFQTGGRSVPYMTVVTDSLEINKTWLCSRSEMWCVTDPWTRDVLVRRDVPEEKIKVTGFPVSPSVEQRSRGERMVWQPGSPFRILYFAGGGTERIKSDLRAIFHAHPDIRVTCIMGRRSRHLYPVLHKIRQNLDYPARFRLVGWTNRVPDFLASHHLVIGKAGGATTHEVIASGRPMLVNYLVPGQEEGNVALLEILGGGRYVGSSGEMEDSLRAMLGDDGELWRRMHQNLLDAGMTGGSGMVASLALQLCSSRSN